MNIRIMLSIVFLGTSFVMQAGPKKMSAAAAAKRANRAAEIQAVIEAVGVQSQAVEAAAAKRAAKENEIARLTWVAEELEAQVAAQEADRQAVMLPPYQVIPPAQVAQVQAQQQTAFGAVMPQQQYQAQPSQGDAQAAAQRAQVIIPPIEQPSERVRQAIQRQIQARQGQSSYSMSPANRLIPVEEDDYDRTAIKIWSNNKYSWRYGPVPHPD